jgi:hypothetical protein
MHGSGYALTFEVNALRIYITSEIQRTENAPIFEIIVIKFLQANIL